MINGINSYLNYNYTKANVVCSWWLESKIILIKYHKKRVFYGKF
ncbi:hypothetical protein ACW9MO_000952 [Campylobacter jejuni]